ncbi:aminotransferase class I/II-fold pyridoxal phosphate-dependent enzyme [Aquimarina sediminis]|uniref:aminotransferase class I/II-fold pyridoxal phosphate-dependent enzyme n=1 Tax=Aquimarina sediminis TaxID=2070536 RepID=UPI000CA00DD3|nr:pyridoxal phosphate-dependent aminotransferase family protein [Aquimarina sediminis]
MQLPKKLQKKLQNREENNSLRRLYSKGNHVDFSSNDYLGFAAKKKIFEQAHKILEEREIYQNGATGSRLLSGNYKLYEETETQLKEFHNAEAALLFNSGYDANIGFFSAIPQRGDLVFYDELIHASIRDGIQMSNAKAYKFGHNDLDDLQNKVLKLGSSKNSMAETKIYVVTESIFSMDGDAPNLERFVLFCKNHNCHLIVDEAHATGVFGECGVGLLQALNLQDQVFARINTFGKAMGCHGAVILGSIDLKKYLINFARSFIYTTGLPPHSLATIQAAYQELINTSQVEKLTQNITFFNSKVEITKLKSQFVKSNSAIHSCIISGNENVKNVAAKLQENGFDVKPILSPTVPRGQERLRFCIHSYNSKEEISEVLELLATFVQA